MASIGKKGNRYYIQLSPGECKGRPKIFLGNATPKQAETARQAIEKLLIGAPFPASVHEWLGGIKDQSILKRLESLDLVESKVKSKWTVAAWIADYIAKGTDVKEATRRKWRDVESKLAAFFRTEAINEITVNHAKNFRTYLQTVAGLSENTLRRHIGIARQFFNAAVDAEIINKNPFRGQSVSVRANDSRFFYVPVETAQAVLAACPDSQWRLIFGLARFGGLRCPSEIVRLKWQDIDFDKQRFTVHASKTEHHADSGIRTVPMFPELKPLFQDAFDDAEPGAVYCISKYNGKWSNVGVHMARIIKKAGVDVWPKLFQNCRSTRETELFKQTGGNIKAVCSWLGNSPVVAMNHYAQTTEADMKEAAKKSVLDQAEKAVESNSGNGGYNVYHPAHETGRNDAQEVNPQSKENVHNCTEKKELALTCINRTNLVQWAVQDLNL